MQQIESSRTSGPTLRILLHLSRLFLFVIASAGSAHAAKPDSVPDWVRAAAAQKIPGYPKETNAVVLLSETNYSVAPDGRATEHFRTVIKVLRPQGREDAIIVIPFDKDTKILSLHAWSIGPDGHEYVVKDNEFAEIGYPGQGNYYEDIKAKATRPPGRDPGGIIAYEYEQRIRPYLTEKTWFFQDDIPRLHQTFTLELPPGYTYGTVWAHHAQSQAADLEHQRWRWSLDETPSIDLDQVLMRPTQLALAGRMTVHYAAPGVTNATQGTWQSIGEWYQTLSNGRLDPTPEIAAKAAELSVGKSDFYEKTEAIAEFVQKQIRYFVIEMGIGGQQPHPAGEIFHNRYGDCKDKATVLSAMLSTVGVHSALVMVDSRRGVIDPDAPSIVGNHMIAAIEIPAGYTSSKLRSVVTAKSGRRYLIFDPTWEKTAFGQLEHNLQGGYGILMEGSSSQVIQFPLLAPELNTIRRSASFHIQPDGTLKGTVTEKRFGDLSEDRRTVFTTGDAKQRSEYMDHILDQDLTTFAISDVKVEDAQSLNKDITTTYSLTAGGFARTIGPLLMLRPRVLGTEGLRADLKKRVVPIDLLQTMQSQD